MLKLWLALLLLSGVMLFEHSKEIMDWNRQSVKMELNEFRQQIEDKALLAQPLKELPYVKTDQRVSDIYQAP